MLELQSSAWPCRHLFVRTDQWSTVLSASSISRPDSKSDWTQGKLESWVAMLNGSIGNEESSSLPLQNLDIVNHHSNIRHFVYQSRVSSSTPPRPAISLEISNCTSSSPVCSPTLPYTVPMRLCSAIVEQRLMPALVFATSSVFVLDVCASRTNPSTVSQHAELRWVIKRRNVCGSPDMMWRRRIAMER